MKKQLFFLILLITFLFGCSSSDITIESAIELADIPLKEVLLTKEVSNGTIAFINLQNQESAIAFLKKTTNGWQLENISGTIQTTPDKDIDWRFYSGKINSDAYPIFFGTINNPMIDKIVIEITNKNEKSSKHVATISKTKDYTFWFLYLSQEMTGPNLEINLTALDKNETIIYKEI